MNRPEIYSQEQGRSYDLLWGWRHGLFGLAKLSSDLLGATAGYVAGLAATQTSPATLSINLAAGDVYQLAAVDSTAYGSLSADSDVILQQGFAPAQTIALSTSGLSSGQSRWALIQAQFSQVDSIPASDPTGGLLLYYNSANPSQPFEGPGNNQQTQNTLRQGVCTITVLYGSVATTGSEVPPTPTELPLYLIDLAYGQTTITNGQILTAGPSVGVNVPSNYPAAPIIAGLLNSHHSGTAGQAPQIKLGSEVQGTLPLANMPASDTTGGIAVMKLNAGNPNGSVAGNASVNGASDFCFDTTNHLLYVCTTTGSASTAVWTSASGASSGLYAGGTSTGSANAQVVASTTPAGFSLTSGYIVTFTAGFTNTAATTLNVDTTGATAINKISGGVPVALTGGEIVSGAFVSVQFNGTVFVLQNAGLGALATLGIGQFLKNDGSGNLTIRNGANLGSDGNSPANLVVLASGVTAGSYKSANITVAADGRLTAASSVTEPTGTTFSSGSGTYTTPAGATRLRVRMVGGGGGGSGSSGTGQNGGAGGTTSFGSFTANGGGGGIAGSTYNTPSTPGVGGSGGSGGGLFRLAGQWGSAVGSTHDNWGSGGIGGSSAFFGGGGMATYPPNTAQQSGIAATGGGGSGGWTFIGSEGSCGGAGGGGGESVEFVIASPAVSYSYSVAGGGAGAGGNGAGGFIVIEEFYD